MSENPEIEPLLDGKGLDDKGSDCPPLEEKGLNDRESTYPLPQTYFEWRRLRLARNISAGIMLVAVETVFVTLLIQNQNCRIGNKEVCLSTSKLLLGMVPFEVLSAILTIILKAVYIKKTGITFVAPLQPSKFAKVYLRLFLLALGIVGTGIWGYVKENERMVQFALFAAPLCMVVGAGLVVYDGFTSPPVQFLATTPGNMEFARRFTFVVRRIGSVLCAVLLVHLAISAGGCLNDYQMVCESSLTAISILSGVNVTFSVIAGFVMIILEP
jgi:hypothetical protein